jgi:hemerythrin-like domain-containing protein
MALRPARGDKGEVKGGAVHKVIEILMSEHRLIEQVLGSLESVVAGMGAGLSIERPLLGDYTAFFRGFADACHHGKEEDILFQRMIERGFPRERGPLAVMYTEHRAGRERVSALAHLAEGSGPLGAGESTFLAETANGFVALLRGHILKEDRILYPMALGCFTGPELDQIEGQFEAFERLIRADGRYDHLFRLADALVDAFPPDPERMAAASAVLADTTGPT